MGKKSLLAVVGGPPPVWDPSLKEPWHVRFEEQPVNDERWSCLVTAAIPAEAADDEYIQSYVQCVDTGLRKSVKIISMADVVKLLKETLPITDTQKTKIKPEKLDKGEIFSRGDIQPLNSRSNQIVALAATYATFTDNECHLPPDLMAAVLKYMILNLKDENYYQKRVDAVKARKMREKEIKAKFISSLKPFCVDWEEKKPVNRIPPNILELKEPIDDQPIAGPDLYILLTDILDAFCFPELVRLNVPFAALLKVSMPQERGGRKYTAATGKEIETDTKKGMVISEFWETLELCMSQVGTNYFKDIATVCYNPSNSSCSLTKKDNLIVLFDELTWMQYSVYQIQRQHRAYLRSLYIQRLSLSLEPLDLDKCEVYNKLCDILVTGGPLTPMLVLFAIVEQVVAGVPETDSVTQESGGNLLRSWTSDIRAGDAEKDSPKPSEEKPVQYVTPCTICRDKVREDICAKLKKATDELISARNKQFEFSEASTSISILENEVSFPGTSFTSNRTQFYPSTLESSALDHLAEILSEDSTRKEPPSNNKKWKTPGLCFFGDTIFLESYDCDPRIVTSETLFNRFFRRSGVATIWSRFAQLTPEDRAFSDFHFAMLHKISREREQSLKLKIHFTISMRNILATHSYVFKGMEENVSETPFSVNFNKLSKIKFSESVLQPKEETRRFSAYFYKTFMAESFRPGSNIMQENEGDSTKVSLAKINERDSLRKVLGNFSMSVVPFCSSATVLVSDELSSMSSSPSAAVHHKKAISSVSRILDLSEVSNLIEQNAFGNNKEYLKVVECYCYYENLEPHILIQKLVDAEEMYNTVYYTYFAPTDSIVAVFMNDSDHRGVFYACVNGVLDTPVRFRDFYGYVYNKILKWLVEEEKRYYLFTRKLREEACAEEEKQDEEYLTKLKRDYCSMSLEERENFLETVVDPQSEPEVDEEELEELPVKPKLPSPNNPSNVATNLADVRVQYTREVNQFFSQDGTEVEVSTDKWLYEENTRLLTLVIKRSCLSLYYRHWLDSDDPNVGFTLKTTSDVIFSFYMDNIEEEGDSNYKMNISWPTGLIIQPITTEMGIYIRQSYVKVYRRGWDIAEEKSRCFLKTGEVIIFKENGDFDILRGSGTKITFCESGGVPGYGIMTTTGEILDVRTQAPCRFRRRLRGTQKVYIGTDPKAQEMYYRREDGVNCMLWPNGKLVTCYSDGTKITSTPFFGEEVTTEWTEEERQIFLEMESKNRLERGLSDLRSRKIPRNTSTPRMTESCIFEVEPFVSISVSYLMEHPKYSTVFFNPEEPHITLKMPDELTVFVHPEGNHEVRRGLHHLTVEGTTAQFFKTCSSCYNRSTTTINFIGEDVLCRTTDFFQKSFVVERTGQTVYANLESDSEQPGNSKLELKKPISGTMFSKCNKHMKSSADSNRIFAFDRNLNGVEFIHTEALAQDIYKLPQNTYYDLHTKDASTISHTFSSPYYKLGYEKWVMDYEEKGNAFPTNLKKSDLKELGCKDNPVKLFKYPFPKYHNCPDVQFSNRPRSPVLMPKVNVVRTVKCLHPQPSAVAQIIRKYVTEYQEKARNITNALVAAAPNSEVSQQSRHVQMRLRKIALTLNQSLRMYPHLCTQFPSTEKEIHYFGHFVQMMEEFKEHRKTGQEDLGECKQIPRPLPTSSRFPPIEED